MNNSRKLRDCVLLDEAKFNLTSGSFFSFRCIVSHCLLLREFLSVTSFQIFQITRILIIYQTLPFQYAIICSMLLFVINSQQVWPPKVIHRVPWLFLVSFSISFAYTTFSVFILCTFSARISYQFSRLSLKKSLLFLCLYFTTFLFLSLIYYNFISMVDPIFYLSF